MISSDTLDTIIAVVVVILLLSMMVQSIQTFLKKLFKIKSKQIESSLVDLFETALGAEPDQTGDSQTKTQTKKKRWYHESPAVRTLLMGTVSPAVEFAPSSVQALHKAVMQRFGEIGRVAQFGGNALESISKADLSHVVASLALDRFLPASLADKFTEAARLVTSARRTITTVTAALDQAAVSPDVQTAWARLREKVAPLVNDIAQLFDDDGQPKGPILVASLRQLRTIDLVPVIELVAKVRTEVNAAATAAPAGDGRDELTAIVSSLDEMVRALSGVPALIDEALAPLRARLASIESWYDTVMHSFEERYNRSMKTWAFVISLLLVIPLNANIFNVFNRISTDSVVRRQLVASAPEIEEAQRKRLADAAKSPAELTAATKELSQAIRGQVGQYQSFGFQPLSMQVIEAWWGDAPGARIVRALRALAGWLLMALLLSLGAPFWHDVLESLFGVKNLLRQRSQTRNTEQERGAGALRSN